MHMQNLKANTVRTAFCALLVSFALVFAGAAQVAVAPTNAYALDTAKCTAKPNVSGSSDVLGGVETRITWEGQADPDEQIAGVTFTLPEGTTCEPGDTRATMLTGDDLMTRTNLDVSADYKDGKLTVNFSEPAQAGGYFRVEIYKVKFSEMGGDMQLTGAYTLADGTEVAMDTLPAITVKSHSFFESLSDSLAQQDWVKSWNSVLFLKLFLNPSVFVSSLPVVFWGFLMAIGIVACAFPLAIPFGLLLSLMRMSKLRVLRGIATAYVNVVRGTPLFLQIYIAFFGLPLAGIQIPTFPLGVIVLAMNSSAYLCEIFRAGIQSISKGAVRGRPLARHERRADDALRYHPADRAPRDSNDDERVHPAVQGHVHARRRGHDGNRHEREDDCRVDGFHHAVCRGRVLLPDHHAAAREGGRQP